MLGPLIHTGALDERIRRLAILKDESEAEAGHHGQRFPSAGDTSPIIAATIAVGAVVNERQIVSAGQITIY